MLGGRRWFLGLLVALLTVTAVSGSAQAQGDPGNLSVLVLGDSYSAGNGAGSYYGSRACWRSAANYGRQFEQLVEATGTPTVVSTVACSGAVTADVLRGRGGRPAQLDAVSPDYDLVVLTIGGNDAGFGSIVAGCLFAVTRQARACDATLAKAERFVSDGTLSNRLANVLSAVRSRTGATSRIVLVGYPYLEGDATYALPGLAGVGQRVRALTDAGDRIGQQVVAAQGGNTVFVSTKQAFAGHELLAAGTNPRRWFVAPLTDAPLTQLDFWYHPNAAGHAAIAKALFDDPRVPKADVR